MFKIKCWYSPGEDEIKDIGENSYKVWQPWERNSYRCRYFEHHIPRYNHNFLLNTMLHHVVMLWIIEINEQL